MLFHSDSLVIHPSIASPANSPITVDQVIHLPKETDASRNSISGNENNNNNNNNDNNSPKHRRRRRTRNINNSSSNNSSNNNNRLDGSNNRADTSNTDFFKPANDDATADTVSITSSEHSDDGMSHASTATPNGHRNQQGSQRGKHHGAISDGRRVGTKGKNGRGKKQKGKYNKQRQQEAKLTKAQKDRYVAMDCEMVGVGPRGYRSMLARVTCIGWDGNVLMDDFVRPTQPVTDYRTYVSGITQQDLDHATMTIDQCRDKVLAILKGKILVGHALKNDLKVLQIHHPWYEMRDTGKYEQFMQTRNGVLWPRKLKDLAKTRLQRDIQLVDRPHDPYEDAKAAMDLFRLVRINWEKCIEYKLERTRQITHSQQVAT